MLNSKEPAGLDKALEEDVEMEGEETDEEPLGKGSQETEWRPGMKLTTSHPSWMWKNNRQDLASRENMNKAGKRWGKGTTSQNRAARRKFEQPRKNIDYWGEAVVNASSSSSNPWQRDEGWWEDGWWSDPWQRDDGWSDNPWERDDDCPWERDEDSPPPLDPPPLDGDGTDNPCEREEEDAASTGHRRRRRRRRRRDQSAGSQRSVSETGSEASAGRQERKRMVWRKRDKQNLQPLEKGSDITPAPLEKGPIVDTKTEPLEKGTVAAASTAPPLEKGSDITPEPLEKGAVVDTKTEPLEKGTAAAASTAPPLEKGSDITPEPLEKGAVVDTKTEPLEKGTAASGSNEEPLEKPSTA